MKVLVEIVGWLGAIMMLSAYVLLTLGRLKSQSPVYHWLNIVSGAGLIVNSGWNGAYPSVCINVVWLIIGLYGVFGRPVTHAAVHANEIRRFAPVPVHRDPGFGRRTG